MSVGPFAEQLRASRERLSPNAVGLAAGVRRRTPGLRRSELALLAGVSVDYLTQLEQGRASSPSAQVVRALGRALQLSRVESRHLHLAAGLPVEDLDDRVPSLVPGGIQRLARQLPMTPVGVFAADWTLLVTNDAWTALFGAQPVGERAANVLWRHFSGLPDRMSYAPDEAERFEHAIVSDLRQTTFRYPADTALAELVAQLMAVSARFEASWRDTRVPSPVTQTKTVTHPNVGSVTLDCDTLLTQDTDLRVLIFTAANADERSKLDVVVTLGLQLLDHQP